ncbi:unnamed protein product [Microthlaspi erraticum]|uniref:Retrotransposon gag domain-containing protein n=1 Tax=Microthlaspi erraticum TaxID=1685480 RepID=A0A6D2I9A7_9BRAS|nr:unnamed protein product [Microthlaspi erraticum]
MATTAPATRSERVFGISQIKAYVPITLDMTKLNYDTWRELFETHCLTFGVLGHLDGSSLPSSATDAPWKERDGLVTMWIFGTITDSLLDTIITKNCTARDLWLSLENLFRDNKEARAIQYDTELRTLTIGDMSVHAYCQKLKTLSDLLANEDSPVSDRSLVMYMLNGLSEKYDYILNVIKHKSPFPTFAAARSMLQMEEDHISKHPKQSISTSPHASSPQILYTSAPPQTASYQNHTSNGNSYGRGNNRNRDRGGRHHRGRGRHHNTGHNWMHPWNYRPPSHPYSFPYQGYPMYAGPVSYPAPPMPFPPSSHHGNTTNSASNGILGPYPTRSTNEAHLTPNAPAAYVASEINNAFSTMSLQDPSESNCYMDTGATSHITAQPGNLLSRFNKSSTSPVIVGNGSYAPVTCIGHVNVQLNLILLVSVLRIFTLGKDFSDVIVAALSTPSLHPLSLHHLHLSLSLLALPFGITVSDIRATNLSKIFFLLNLLFAIK